MSEMTDYKIILERNGDGIKETYFEGERFFKIVEKEKVPENIRGLINSPENYFAQNPNNRITLLIERGVLK